VEYVDARPIAEFADRLAVMSDDELFTCRGLKKKAKISAPASATVSRDALVKAGFASGN
jgi:tRNA U34 5-methylaminomethyl-2-thiouridine-forming methyltransferase MnmC